MITIKSEREIELMRKAGNIVAMAMNAVEKAIKPGISTHDLDKVAYNVIIANNATPSFLNYEGYPATICASINEVVIHGIPSKKVLLRDGDIISIDIGAIYHGYHGDHAKTFEVGTISEEKKLLLKVTKNALFEGLKYARPNNRLSDISHAIEEYVKPYGFGVIRDFTGHGVGSHLHEDPAIPNYGEAGHGPLLRKGMTLAIEPMVALGTYRVRILKDNWTTVTQDKLASAHFEHTIAITDDGCEILTKIEGEEINV